MQQFDAWLTLIHVDKLGPVTLQKLFAHFHSAENILQASRSELQALKISNAIIEGIHTPKKRCCATRLSLARA